MPKTKGYYEKTRDDYSQPTFWRTKNNFCHPHFHSALELNYVVKGEMEALVDGEGYTARQGELLVVSPYSLHKFTTPVSSDNYVLIVPRDYIRSFETQLRGKRFAGALLPKGEGARQIARCMQLLLKSPAFGQEMWPQPRQDSYILRGQVYTILGILLESLPLQQMQQPGSHAFVRDVLGYLDANYRQPVTLGALAAKFGYSRSRISHAFNKEVGCSIPEYLGTLRARAAASMLLEEEAGITDVALEAGFESMRSFYRIFKASFGVTPTQFTKLPRAQLRLLMNNNGLAV